MTKNNLPAFPVQTGILRHQANRSLLSQGIQVLAFLLFTLLLIPSLAHAEETEPKKHEYLPEYCDFNIDFPEDPYTTRRCEDDTQDKCYDQISYTRVYDMTTTVNFRVICNAVNKDIIDQYSGEVMVATLKAMTQRSVVQEFNTSFTEEEKYKMAGLVGEGQTGRTPTIYIAQLWISDKSAFSVEAELIGDINDEADQMFSTVLRSLGHDSEFRAENKVDAETKKSEENK